MCEGCLAEYGGPVEWTPEMEAARSAVAALYEVCPTGGPMHVQIDDMNVGNEYFGAAHRDSLPRWAGDAEELELGRAAFDALAPLSEAQRATVCYGA
jgi:hypothetical protein